MKLRKLIALLLALVICLGCIACTNESASTDEPAPQSGTAAEEVKQEEPVFESKFAKLPEHADEEEASISPDYDANYEFIDTGAVPAGVSVHDPSIYVENGVYYIFGSHLASASSTDLRKWTLFTKGFGKGEHENVYGDILNADSGVFDWSGAKWSVNPINGFGLWAPDVVYNPVMGKYMLYYCTSTDFYTSSIMFGTSDSLTGPYDFEKIIVYSGFNEKTIKDTDVLSVVSAEDAQRYYSPKEYEFKKWPNAIDPSVFFDADNRLWMTYGSFSGGIFLLELDPATGLPIHPALDEENDVDPYFGRRLLGGNHKSMEGPYILYDAEAGYYYLYVSYGGFEAYKGYQIRVFRSKNVEGPYVDMNGLTPNNLLNHAMLGLKLSGNYDMPSVRKAYVSTGHNSAFIDKDGKRYIVYHTRYDNNGEVHNPRVKQYFLNEEGWPCMLPYATNGETISQTGYGLDEVVGRYYVTNQGTKIDGEIAKPFILYLTEKGNVFGEGIQGTWYMADGAPYVHITIDGVVYSGVFCAMEDEAKTDCMTFTAVGDNSSMWGVKYDEELIAELKEYFN